MTLGPGLAKAGGRLVRHERRQHVSLDREAWSLAFLQAPARVEGAWALDQSGWYGTVDVDIELPPNEAAADAAAKVATKDPHVRLLAVRRAREIAEAKAGASFARVSAEVKVSHVGGMLRVTAELDARSTTGLVRTAK